MAGKLDTLLLLQDSNISMQLVLKNVRNFQTHEIYTGRKCFGEYHHLFPLLKKHVDKFNQYVRMNVDTFGYLLSNIQDSLTKNWCNLHTQPILPEERLILTLRFLATGSSYSHLAFSFRMGISTVSTIIQETMNVLWRVLQPIHMPIPTKDYFLEIAEQFFIKWNFPHWLGAIDGRHIRIKKPAHSGSLYFNYKKFFSVVLQAVVDANYRFISIDVGGYGHQSDGGTFKASNLYKALIEKKLHIPDENELPNSRIILPYFFIGDGAYPLMENVMKPYPGKNLPNDHKNFNKRLSRARAVVENTFGFTCQKWQIFYTTIDKPPDVVNLIVKCTCVLHNVLSDLECQKLPDSFISNLVTPDNTLVPTISDQTNFVIGLGKEVRHELSKYFMENPKTDVEN